MEKSKERKVFADAHLEAGDKKARNEIRKYLKCLMPLNRDLIHNLFWKGAVFNAGISLMEDKYLKSHFGSLKMDGVQIGMRNEQNLSKRHPLVKCRRQKYRIFWPKQFLIASMFCAIR